MLVVFHAQGIAKWWKKIKGRPDCTSLTLFLLTSHDEKRARSMHACGEEGNGNDRRGISFAFHIGHY